MFVTVLPLGIYLPSGVTIKTEKGTLIAMTLQACTQQGCIATTKLSAKQIKAIKSENEMTITFSADKSTPITVSVSLNGISAGLKEIN